MKLIQREAELIPIEGCIDRLIDRSQVLPRNVFSDHLRHFLFLPFDLLLSEALPGPLQAYMQGIGENACWLIVLEPDPRLYFGQHFDFLGAFEFEVTDSAEQYLDALNHDPGESPADAIMHNANRFALVSPSANWVIYGQRDTDVAVCGFAEQYLKESFNEAFGSHLLRDVLVAAQYGYEESADEIGVFCESYSK